MSHECEAYGHFYHHTDSPPTNSDINYMMMINKCRVLELHGMNVNDHNLQFFSAVVLPAARKV